jgi:lipopolysaccharide biosynthesis glycosyltransferase
MDVEMRVYLGFDQREKLAYDVCKHSIEHNTHNKIQVIPLSHKQLRRQGWFARPWLVNAYDGNMVDMIDGRPFSTEFSHTRFLVPALAGYEGWALFMDCDMVFDDDIKHLFAQCDDKYAVMVVKHHHKPIEQQKMDGVPQSQYYRKNWSSFVLWNCGHPANQKLTPEVINTHPGSWLHGFSWLEDVQIGNLSFEYNWIEGVSPSNLKPKVIHYTHAGPWFQSGKEATHASVWWKYYDRWLDAGEYIPIQETVDVDYGVWQ